MQAPYPAHGALAQALPNKGRKPRKLHREPEVSAADGADVSANNGGCRPHKVAVIYIWQHWLHIFYTAIAYRIKNNA